MKTKHSLLRNCLWLKTLRLASVFGCLMLSGCSIFPEIYRQPQFHNPFPQLSRVAVAPFFNLSNEKTVDGQKVALAYYNALQDIPGYEVVPVGVTETVILNHKIDLRGPKGADEARRLAQIMKVDAVVIGAVTDYSPYYPPRMGMEVQWYAANPGFHEIPAGYGLPWGTPDEKDIPGPLVFEAELALAKAQLKTQTPPQPVTLVPEAPRRRDADSSEPPLPDETEDTPPSGSSHMDKNVKPVQFAAGADSTGMDGKDSATETALPSDWPDPRGFIPPGPSATRPPYRPSRGPVLHHVNIYIGNDGEFTTALSSYCVFRDEARFGGWQGYLQRSDDFIRFCCYKHITEMITARGGAGESKVVWRWPDIR
jgi:hypothetical protein